MGDESRSQNSNKAPSDAKGRNVESIQGPSKGAPIKFTIEEKKGTPADEIKAESKSGSRGQTEIAAKKPADDEKNDPEKKAAGPEKKGAQDEKKKAAEDEKRGAQDEKKAAEDDKVGKAKEEVGQKPPIYGKAESTLGGQKQPGGKVADEVRGGAAQEEEEEHFGKAEQGAGTAIPGVTNPTAVIGASAGESTGSGSGSGASWVATYAIYAGYGQTFLKLIPSALRIADPDKKFWSDADMSKINQDIGQILQNSASGYQIAWALSTGIGKLSQDTVTPVTTKLYPKKTRSEVEKVSDAKC
jgi:hypothetical protein